ncbi:MAG: ROK family protein [Mucilaginibacter sp.]
MPDLSISSLKSILIDKTGFQRLSNIDRKKYLQKVRLVKYIHAEGAQSNASISNFLNLSLPTSITLINELIEEELLERKGRGESVGGRKPDLYALRDNSFYILSIDMERFKIKMAIFDNNNNNITGIQSFTIPITQEITAVTELYDIAQNLISNSKIDKNKLIGIGIDMPGLVDMAGGENYTYLFSGKESKTLKLLLEEKFNKPVFIQNDVKSATLAEARFGLARDKENVLVLLMDWGVGLGVIMGGKLQNGTSGFSGEFGHIPFIDDGSLCYCGKRGCLETVASGIALAKMAKEGIKSGQNSILNELSDQEIDKIEPQLVIDAANRGDQYAISILADIGIKLGKGIAILIQLFNPELIILGGKMAEAKQYMTIPIQQSINTYCMTQMRERVNVVLSKLGQDAAIIGTVGNVIENILEQQIQLAS